jgi:hypothetical protein
MKPPLSSHRIKHELSQSWNYLEARIGLLNFMTGKVFQEEMRR